MMVARAENEDTFVEPTEKAQKEPDSAHPGEVSLKRRVGLLTGISFTVGAMIGSGIFISPKGVLLYTGSVGLSLSVWAACGLISILGALTYAELGTLVQKSGSDYTYYLAAFGKLHPWLGPIPAFLFSWTTVVLVTPGAYALLSLTFAQYALRPFYLSAPEWAIKSTAAGCILTAAVINCVSVKLAVWIQNVFTTSKLVAVMCIVVGGIVKLAEGNTQYLESGFDGSSTSVGDIATAFYSGLWAYSGWNHLNYLTEEVINPAKTVPRALITGVLVVTVCYLAVNVAYLTVMSVPDLLESNAVGVTFGERVFGQLSWVIPLFVVCSTFGSSNGTCFASARLCYAAAREGHMLPILSHIHAVTLTPIPAILFNSILALLMIIPGNVGNLINFLGFVGWLFIGLSAVSLITLRFTQPDSSRPYKVPILVPVVVVLVSAYLVLAPMIDSPQWEYLYAGISILAGLLLYFPFVVFKFKPTFLDTVTSFCVDRLLLVPPNKTTQVPHL